MKKIYLLPNRVKDPSYGVTACVAEKLLSLGAQVVIPTDCGLNGQKIERSDIVAPDCDLIVVVGGDGSMIDASAAAIAYGIPLLGINLGKLGYLTEVEPTESDALERLFTGEYRVEQAHLLAFEIEGEAPTGRVAVNDVIFSHEEAVGLTDLVLTDEKGACVRYRADALICSTPIGSTAYSFSAGGPIVSHDVDATVVTPVCPHSLFNRSLIFPGSEVLTVEAYGDQNLTVTIDGRFFGTLKSGKKCSVFSSEKKLKLIRLTEGSRFRTLFDKMRRFEEF